MLQSLVRYSWSVVLSTFSGLVIVCISFTTKLILVLLLEWTIGKRRILDSSTHIHIRDSLLCLLISSSYAPTLWLHPRRTMLWNSECSRLIKDIPSFLLSCSSSLTQHKHLPMPRVGTTANLNWMRELSLCISSSTPLVALLTGSRLVTQERPEGWGSGPKQLFRVRAADAGARTFCPSWGKLAGRHHLCPLPSTTRLERAPNSAKTVSNGHQAIIIA